MIYLILSAGFKDDDSLEKLLKIGYTEDNNLDRRIYQYKSHNPTIKLLYTIPEGTMEMEDLLHSQFSKLRYEKYGKEWYYYDEEILQFFEINKSIDNLKDILDFDLKVGDPRKRFNGFTKYCHSIIDHCLNYKMKLDNTFTINQAMNEKTMCFEELDQSGLVLKEGVSKFILNYFNITNDQYQEYINIKLPKKVLKFVEEFNSLPTFYDKMKSLCESEFTEGERLTILEQVPILYKNMYLKVGPARLKANGYHITSIKKELVDTSVNSEIDLGKELCKYFQIGQRYSLIDIKDKLKAIFDEIGYRSTPKASILSDYFEIKKIKVPSSDGLKKDHGYEILKKKD